MLRSIHPRSLAGVAAGLCAGGAQASARPVGALAPGLRCDLVELDPDHPTLVGHQGDALLDAWVFSGNANPVRTVVVGGRAVVEAGRHIRALELTEIFTRTMRKLMA